MSFAVQSASLSAGTRAAAHAGVVEQQRERREEARRADAAPERRAPNVRHALVDALDRALQSTAPAAAGDPAPTEPRDARALRHAFHGFVHALFAELRPSDAEGRHGRGFAWGRTSAVDLALRLDGLAERLRGGVEAEAPTVEAPPVVNAPTAALADNVVADETAGTVAADSPLLAAFRRLLAARDGSAAEHVEASETAASLAAVLERLAAALAGNTPVDGPVAAGSLIDVTV